eukprot:4694197-Amphidinium_carterae.1
MNAERTHANSEDSASDKRYSSASPVPLAPHVIRPSTHCHRSLQRGAKTICVVLALLVTRKCLELAGYGPHASSCLHDSPAPNLCHGK